MGRFADFDAALQVREPVRCRLFGGDWELHSDLPAAVAVQIVRWEADPGRELTDQEILQVIEWLVPADVLAAWYERGLGLGQLSEILPMLIGLYFSAEAGSAEQAPAGDPKAPSASSSAGD